MLLLQLALALGGTGVPAASVGSMSLADMVRYSDSIVVARVKDSRPFPLDQEWGRANHLFRPTLRIGELEVERWVKGARQEQPLVFLNDSTWTCDVTGAEVGGRALYFLGLLCKDSEIAAHLEGFEAAYRDRLLHAVLHSGRGQMDLRVVDSIEVCTYWDGDVRLPEDAPSQPGPEPRYDFVKSIPLPWMAAHVDELVKAQRAPQIKLLAAKGTIPGDPWELTVDFDRTAKLVIDRLDGKVVQAFTLSRDLAWEVDDALREHPNFHDGVDVGAEASESWDRSMTVWVGAEEMSFRVGELAEVAEYRKAQAAARIWTALRSSFAFPECIDHREADRKALERR